MKKPAKDQFGYYDKRNKEFLLVCTPEEKQAWQKHWGVKLSQFVRSLLNKRLKKLPVNKPPARPAKKKTTARVGIKVSESELFAWKMQTPAYGTRSCLGRVVCDLLNKEMKRSRLKPNTI